MTCLRQLISAYEAVWTKSVAAEQKKKDVSAAAQPQVVSKRDVNVRRAQVQSEQDAKELKAALLRAAESVAKNQYALCCAFRACSLWLMVSCLLR